MYPGFTARKCHGIIDFVELVSVGALKPNRVRILMRRKQMQRETKWEVGMNYRVTITSSDNV